MFIALNRTVEQREGGWVGGWECDIELLRKLSLCLKITEIVGVHCHEFLWKSVQYI